MDRKRIDAIRGRSLSVRGLPRVACPSKDRPRGRCVRRTRLGTCTAEDPTEGSIPSASPSRDLDSAKDANSARCDGSERFGGAMAKHVEIARSQPVGKGREMDVERQVKQHGVWRLLQEAKREGKCVTLALVLLLLGSAVSFVLPGIAASAIDLMLDAEDGQREEDGRFQVQTRINECFLIMFLLSILGACFSGLRGYLFTAAGERIVASIRERFFASILKQEVAFHDEETIGSLLSRLSEDTTLIKDACTVHMSSALRNILAGLFSLIGMLYYSWELSLLALVMMPAMVVVAGMHSRKVRQLSYEMQYANSQAMALAGESWGAVKTVKAFSQEQHESIRYSAAVQRSLFYGLAYASAYGMFVCVLTLTSVLGLLSVMWYGSYLVLHGSMTIGMLAGFAMYAFSVVSSFTNMGSVLASFSAAVGSSQRVWELMDRVPGMPQLESMVPRGQPEGARVNFENVWFSYPGRPSHWVLQDLTAEILPGTKAALVGPSGGGKSTIVNLIERFYDPNKGLVKIDGMDVRKIDQTWLHRNIGFVSQDPILFADTIAYNIMYAVAESDRDEKKMVEAAKLANAHDFIMRLPYGYETHVGERGATLSGGQRQRIAIARALLMQPRLLLLDEATSALDAETEYLVEEALNKLIQGRTVLVIAHRLSTVVNSHKVILINEGQVQEHGTHTELLRKDGFYAALVQRQLRPIGDECKMDERQVLNTP